MEVKNKDKDNITNQSCSKKKYCECCSEAVEAEDKKQLLTKKQLEDKLFEFSRNANREADWYINNGCERLHENYIVQKWAWLKALSTTRTAKTKKELQDKLSNLAGENQGCEWFIRKGAIRLGELQLAKENTFIQAYRLIEEVEEF